MGAQKKTAKVTLEQVMIDLRREIVETRMEYRRANQTRRALAVSFLKGTTSAVGALAAVVIVMPAIVWALRTIEWPPIVSGFVSKVISQIELANQKPPAAVDQ